MKKLTFFGILIILFAATTGALASDKGKGNGGKHGNQHYQQKGHHYGHYNHGGRYYRPYRPYPSPRYYGRYYRPNYYYPSYLGAALVGSAITYSLYHTHNGAYCYDNHTNDNYQQGNGSYSEVVGCHRMERQLDGSERRVEVPMSQCN